MRITTWSALLLLTAESLVFAQAPPTAEECSRLLTDCMRMCRLTAHEISGRPELEALGGAALPDALRCLADCMGDTRCDSAVLVVTIDDVRRTIRWARNEIKNANANEIAIATSHDAKTASASATGATSSLYASGGTSGGAKADCESEGADSLAFAAGGGATEGVNAGDASANSLNGKRTSAFAEGGRGSGRGSKGGRAVAVAERTATAGGGTGATALKKGGEGGKAPAVGAAWEAVAH